MRDLTCVTCGGDDFYKNAGFFYCSECQTQAPDVQEQEFEREVADQTVLVEKTQKVKTSDSSKSARIEQLTSWECYNYILLGLVNELIELGAKSNLKPTVQSLWFSYLKKIEVLHNDPNKVPNLPAYNNKHNAKVIFGRCAKKKVYKRKRRASCSSVSDAGSTISKREQNRLNKAMAKAIYESQQTQSTVQSESSLLNQSLTSLKSSTSEPQREHFLSFSKRAKTELRRYMSKGHLKEHVEDVDVSLTCHNLSFKDVGKGYGDSPYAMKPIFLYVLLYLGLLINKDDMQIGDLLRFMNEGSLSYNYYNHFFPEEIDAQVSFLNTLPVTKIYKTDHFRLATGKMIDLLNLKEDIPVPNILNLIKRYCKELNLPDKIFAICVNFITRTQPKMNITTTLLPNYEGRAMCVIIFVLKLLFGLDDATEINLSAIASKINETIIPKKTEDDFPEIEMFNLMDWLHTIAYRRCVLAKYHFPTGYLEKNYSLQEYIGFINAYYKKHDMQRQEDLDYENIDRITFNDSEYNGSILQFTPSLTPLYNNLKTLFESGLLQADHIKLEILLRNYQHSSLEYLKDSSKFTPKSTVIISKGANDNIKLVPVHRNQTPQKNANRDVPCKLSKKKREDLNIPEQEKELTQQYLKQFDYLHAEKFNKTDEDINSKLGISIDDYVAYYRPDRRHWLHLRPNISDMIAAEFDQFWLKFPYHYRLIVSECACITMQSLKELLLEYNYFEAVVCYGNPLSDDRKKKKKTSNKLIDLSGIKTIVAMGEKRW